MHTARIPPMDPAPATITAVLAMHAGHICLSSELLIRPSRFASEAATTLASITADSFSRTRSGIQGQGHDAFVPILQCAQPSRIYPLKRLIEKRSAETSVGVRDQDCLLRDVHAVLH